MVEDARRRFGTLPGVLAQKDAAARFTRSWTAATGVSAEIGARVLPLHGCASTKTTTTRNLVTL